jgi:acetyl-CoA carboxylase carboxyl transferase subunit alpha
MNHDGPVLEFEKPVYELEKRIAEMRNFAVTENMDALADEIKRLEKEVVLERKKIYSNLTRWQRVLIARHAGRPRTLDYIEGMMTDFFALHGDRAFGDDKAMVAGMAKLNGESVVVVGHQKGTNTKENVIRNWGMAGPEGYRKAMRIMKLGEKFEMPVLALIDTPGAYPGAGAEERGQAEAIARNIYEMGQLRTPIIIAVIGEGASGGALGIGVGDRIMMMENAWYSVISPEPCSTILWKDQEKAADRKADCAEALRLSATDLLEFGVIDEIIPEPFGGAHWDHETAIAALKKVLVKSLKEVKKMSTDEMLDARLDKYSNMGAFEEVTTEK